jgi:hypothetical protein
MHRLVSLTSRPALLTFGQNDRRRCYARMARMIDELPAAVEASDKGKALEYFKAATEKGYKAWDVHLSLYPVAQRVLNPPFINPHLPKMYAICREFIPYLEAGEVAPLVHIEVGEYARRPKLERPSVGMSVKPAVPFDEIEAAIRAEDRGKTVSLLSAFHEREGGGELAKRLLLLGSGYLDQSLGHSLSCTAFILLEMLERPDQDPLPTLFALAHYFCRGHFHTTPHPTTPGPPFSEEALAGEMLKATSGQGFMNIHHTITLYAVERVSHLFTADEHQQLLAACKAFIGQKETRKVDLGAEAVLAAADYDRFYQVFSGLNALAAVKSLVGLAGSQNSRRSLGRFLIKGVCDLYNGAYNPHYLTGLGAALWAVNRFAGNGAIATNALYQYVDFFFSALKSNE